MGADWYPDPLGRAELRFHDGSAWTHDVATNGLQTKEPVGFPLPRRAPGDEPAPAPPPPAPGVISAPPPTGSPMPAYYPTAQPRIVFHERGGGRLVAAGVLTIISGVGPLIWAFLMLVFAANVNRLDCGGTAFGGCPSVLSDASAAFYVIGGIMMVISLLVIAAGIGACARRYWGQVSVIVISGLGAVLPLIGLLAGEGTALLVPLAWSALVITLAATNRRADYELPTRP